MLEAVSRDRDEPRPRELSASARRHLAWMAEQLRDGFSGTFTLECNNGGVRDLKFERSINEADLKGSR